MSESCGGMRKRMLDEDKDAEDLVQSKSLRGDDTDSDSSSTASSSSGSTLVSSDDEQTASDATSTADMPVPFGSLQDLLQSHSQADALSC